MANFITGTGLGGRITTDDLNNQRTGLTEQNDFTEIKLTNIRKMIAKSMLNSLTTTAQLTLNFRLMQRKLFHTEKKSKNQKIIRSI